jgi:hypothetical protein
MSDAPAAPVTEQGVPPATQTEEAPSFKVTYCPLLPALQRLSRSIIQVFIGNLAYSTTDEGLKAFFEPVQSDMYGFFLISCLMSVKSMLITDHASMTAASPPRL